MDSEVTHSDQAITPRRKSLLELSNKEAQEFLLKGESYCTMELPNYFTFDNLISGIHKILSKNKFSRNNKPRDYDDVNHTIFNNKDGKYAWRPLQLIHPVLYVALVHLITEQSAWELIVDRFKLFSRNSQIRCLSIPVVSLSSEKDKAEQVLHWWSEIEQYSIELALEYENMLEVDIADCYAAIYTHSISWSLHTKDVAKKNKYCKKLVGNQIDKYVQDMCRGQTNGIPQGSVLMDFIAEMVLGYVDLELCENIKCSNITDYKILRYRDDYRIFVNNPRDGEYIIKSLTEVIIPMGLKLNSSKTKASNDIIISSIKPDKISWIFRKRSDKNLQKHLLIIYNHALQFPNAGSLLVALNSYYKRIKELKSVRDRIEPLISIVVDIAYKNPRTYAISAAILSKLLNLSESPDQKSIIEQIKKKFSRTLNTGLMQVWLQRISYAVDKNSQYDQLLCKQVIGDVKTVWNHDWIESKELKKVIDTSKIVDEEVLQKITTVIPSEEVELFSSNKGWY